MQTPNINQTRADILARIAKTAQASGRDPRQISLIAVSKRQAPAQIEAMLATPQRLFGESRVQEALARWPDLRAQYPDVVLHMLGPLQSNKAQDAVKLFDMIHSLDRPKLARALALAQEQTGRRPQILVQINTGEEPQKSGIIPEEADAFIAQAREVFTLDVVGLMALPPKTEPAGPHFALLADIAKRNGLEKLSMGMSADFETAIMFGATHIRLGTALFGPRQEAAMVT